MCCMCGALGATRRGQELAQELHLRSLVQQALYARGERVLLSGPPSLLLGDVIVMQALPNMTMTSLATAAVWCSPHPAHCRRAPRYFSLAHFLGFASPTVWGKLSSS